LRLKIIKVHEKQSFIEKAPWHAPGGDWTFLECAVGKNPSSKVLIGTRSRGSTKGNLPISWGEGMIAVTDNNAGIAFIEAFSKTFHQPASPRYGTNPPGYIKVNAAVFGVNQVRGSKGGFRDGRKGTWTASKWFLQSENAEAEVFFNYSTSEKRAEFSEKDEEYREELIEQLVIGLRDGPLPERTPDNDRTLTLIGPHVVAWAQIAGTNETAQFTPIGDRIVITMFDEEKGAKLYLASIQRPQERQKLADFEGSVLLHDFLFGERGLTIFLAETIRKDREILSTADPQRLWLVNAQDKRQVTVPAEITNWFAGKGSISPDGKFLALHSWRRQGNKQNSRVIHVGDLQSGRWRTAEAAGTVLELVGWTGEKPKGIVLTGNSFAEKEVRKPNSLDPESAQLTPLETTPLELNPARTRSPTHKRAPEVLSKEKLRLTQLPNGQKREFTFDSRDRRNVRRDSIRWASDRYLVFQGTHTALIDSDTLKMNYPLNKDSGFSSVEFSPDFKWALGTKQDGQYMGKVELPANLKVAQ